VAGANRLPHQRGAGTKLRPSQTCWGPRSPHLLIKNDRVDAQPEKKVGRIPLVPVEEVSMKIFSIWSNWRRPVLVIAPGTAGFLDLPFEETRSADRRIVFIPMPTVAGGPALCSFAVLDSAKGIAITQSSPAAVQSAGR
jgi:hypothetical protein